MKQKPIPLPPSFEEPFAPSVELPLKEINPRISIGSPIEISFDNDKYRRVIKAELNTGEALWYGRWGNRWSGEGKYDFTELNKNINWIKQNGLSPTVHMLVGPDIYMPDWLIEGTWEEAKLDNLLRGLIDSIMDSNDNKDKVETWNVINELFEDDGSYRKNMVWNKMGWEKDTSDLVGEDKINEQHPVFIRKAFTYCREKTKAKLELRDFNIENNDPVHDNDKRHKAIYQLLKHMINGHIPVDAIGIQGHLIVGKSSWRLKNNAMRASVEKFKALGIEVFVTEIDAGIEKRTWSDAVAQEQKEDYYDYVKQALEGGATRISFWGIQDGMDKGWLTQEHPLLWTENFERKPAYFGVKQALMDSKK